MKKTILGIAVASLLFGSCSKNVDYIQQPQTSQTSSTGQPTKPSRNPKHFAYFGQNVPNLVLASGIDFTDDNGVFFHCIAGGPRCDAYFDGPLAPIPDATGTYKGGMDVTPAGVVRGHFLWSTMDAEVRSYFNNGYMNMIQQRVLPNDIAEAPDISPGYIITEGMHPYVVFGDTVIVDL